MVPESMLPAFYAIQLQVEAKKQGDLKRVEEIGKRLSEWFAEHPDIHVRFAEEFRRAGFKLSPEKIARARDLARPIGSTGKVLRYLRRIWEAILAKEEKT